MPFTDFNSGAAWRPCRHSMAQVVAQLNCEGIELSSFFKLPGFCGSFITIDFLHTVDVGVSQDVLGNLFHEWFTLCLPRMNKDEKAALLWAKIKTYYKRCTPATRLNGLTYEMIRQPSKGPKFRGQRTETKQLVPFGLLLSKEMHEAIGSTMTKTM